MKRLLAAAGLAVVLVVALASPAAAHAELVSTSPSSGAELEASPSQIVIRFNQRVQVGAGVQLFDSRGRRRDGGGVTRIDDGRSLRLPVDDLADGGYVVTWRVVSADGHPVNGGITFRIGADSANVSRGLLQQLLDAEGGDRAVRAVAAVVRALMFAMVLLFAGGLVFVLSVWPTGLDGRRTRATLFAAAAVGAVATLAGVGLQGADVAGLGIGHAVDLSTIWDTVDTQFGHMAVARVVLLAVLGIVLAALTTERAQRRQWQLVVLVGLAGLLATITYAGHARTGRWLAAAVPLDVVHLGAGAFWVGGLALLCFLVLPLAVESARATAERFSRLAWWAVIVVVATGVAQGWRQVGDLDGLRDTSYGKLLVVKVVLVAVIVAFAGFSRSLLQRMRAEEEDPAALRSSLRRSVAVESAIAAVVLAVTSLLVAADPSRTESAGGYVSSVVVDGSIIEGVVTPARRGPVAVHLYLQDQRIPLTTTVMAEATIELPDRDIPPIKVDVRRITPRHWSAYELDLPIAGTWRLRVLLTIGDLDTRTATFEIPIR